MPFLRRGLRASACLGALLCVSTLCGAASSLENFEIGKSVSGKPVRAVQFSDGSLFEPNKLRVMLVAAQHGNEPSGPEALLRILDSASSGSLDGLLPDVHLVFIPAANPDGLAARSRSNSNGADLDRNYTLLSEPETQAVFAALRRWRPHVLLDLHESAEPQARVEVANNPNIAAALRDFSAKIFFPEWTAALRKRKLVTNADPRGGDLTFKNLRNFSAAKGVLSFSIENRDAAAQAASIEAFLQIVKARKNEILQACALASDAGSPRRAFFSPSLAPDGALIEGPSLKLPFAYWIARPSPELRELFLRHHFAFVNYDQPVLGPTVCFEILSKTRMKKKRFPAGKQKESGLWLRPYDFLVPLLLELRSSSSVFQESPFSDMVQTGPHFVCRESSF